MYHKKRSPDCEAGEAMPGREVVREGTRTPCLRAFRSAFNASSRTTAATSDERCIFETPKCAGLQQLLTRPDRRDRQSAPSRAFELYLGNKYCKIPAFDNEGTASLDVKCSHSHHPKNTAAQILRQTSREWKRSRTNPASSSGLAHDSASRAAAARSDFSL